MLSMGKHDKERRQSTGNGEELLLKVSTETKYRDGR